MTNRAPLITAIVLLLLPVLYVGSYLALVERCTIKGFHSTHGKGNPYYGHFFLYPCGMTKVGSKIYWPLEQIDRKVRPGE